MYRIMYCGWFPLFLRLPLWSLLRTRYFEWSFRLLFTSLLYSLVTFIITDPKCRNIYFDTSKHSAHTHTHKEFAWSNCFLCSFLYAIALVLFGKRMSHMFDIVSNALLPFFSTERLLFTMNRANRTQKTKLSEQLRQPKMKCRR